jgi:hypothetical protein
MWRLHFKHHDGNDDGENSIAESFQTAFIHLISPVLYCETTRPKRRQPVAGT